MHNQKETMRIGWLSILLLGYCAASLLHYVHNAVFLDEYPNLPAWLSPARICAAWLGVTAIGVAGYFLVRRGNRLAGLVVLAVYGALGLVNWVVSAERLAAETESIARRLAQGATLAFAETKRLVNHSHDQALAAQLNAEVEAFARCAATRDFAEGVTAFIEKRKPNFKGE